jgi:hypothetical protein
VISLPGADPTRIEYTRKDSVDKTVRAEIARQIAEQRAKEAKGKLTWTDPQTAWKNRGAAGYEGEPVGHDGFDNRLPYGAYDRYRIQNCRIYMTNGDEITLEQVPDEVPHGIAPHPIGAWTHSCSICEHRAEGPCRMRELVSRQLETYKKNAASLDPFLCKLCFKFTANAPDDYTDHMLSEHPAEIAKRHGIGETSSSPDKPSFVGSPHLGPEASPPPAPPSTAVEPDPNRTTTVSTFEPTMKYEATTTLGPAKVPYLSAVCEVSTCRRVFGSESALKRHITVKHTPKG